MCAPPPLTPSYVHVRAEGCPKWPVLGHFFVKNIVTFFVIKGGLGWGLRGRTLPPPIRSTTCWGYGLAPFRSGIFTGPFPVGDMDMITKNITAFQPALPLWEG